MDLDANQLRSLTRRDPQAAVIQLIEIYYERIYAFVRRLAGNDADAADLTQRTFGRVQQALSAFAGRSSVSSWIHSIAYHLYVDWRRANQRLEPRPDEWWQARSSEEPSPDEVVARDDLAKALYGSVDQLEPELRDCIHLHYYQGLTLQETADATEVAASTVKYRLRQALVKLQKQLSADHAAPKPL
jgi:RNA polymerase sigma-70 factor, ECF subfamily